MKTRLLHSRHSGMSLIELLIFIAILAIIVGSILPLLFSASEDRLLQQTISVVEQNGAQALNNSVLRIGNAERVISPLPGETGSVLVLQTASGSTNPTIIGFSSGSLVIIEGTTQQNVTSSQVALTDFVAKNTSTSTTHQSVHIGFTISRTTRLQQPHYYTQYFETTVQLLPADEPVGASCGCADPYCSPTDTYNWQVCQSGTCYSASTQLTCAQ
ncbi:MAG TPA: prepilin-type N-terminal cleavage/methylation domain-containing protein [Candidatus Peribacteraceae bacterium]|nr:prepilin-type N-terminal cleavage/methylation domain-containing protein [Candidatus Peribacteraceae bacterium]